MGLLRKIIPTNLLEEKERFFADQTYNPQFVYSEEFDQRRLYTYGHPNEVLSNLAKEILQKTFYHRNEEDLFMLEGRRVTQQQADEVITNFIDLHKLRDRIEIVWSSSFIARATMSTNRLKLRLPADFRKEGLEGMLYHEIGTHALRRLNYERQPWYKNRTKHGMQKYLETEEGLASLHSLVAHSYRSAYIPAIRYIAVAEAQQKSFAELWKTLSPYTQDLERRWTICVREKRGLTDTSQPGGYSKDLLYFQGLVKVWQWLRNHDFDCTKLYYGKMACEDVETAISLNPQYQPDLPLFFTLNKEKYARAMEDIGLENQLHQITL